MDFCALHIYCLEFLELIFEILRKIILRCYDVDWKSRVIAQTETYVVLDKPAGIPVCAMSTMMVSRKESNKRSC